MNPNKIRLLTFAILIFAITTVQTLNADNSQFDVVFSNARVMDPESGLDGVRNVGIRGNRIAEISAEPLNGKTVIDAKGLVLAPGFIDLHSHGQSDENYRYKAMDGVTTALELEVGVSPVAKWYSEREGKALVNFGATSGHIPASMIVMKDTGDFLPRDNALRLQHNTDQVQQIKNLVATGLNEGALGIGYGINYVPTTTRAEILDLFALAASYKVGNFAHLRYGGASETDGAIVAVQEVLADAAATGASLHIVHITSTCLRQTDICLQMIDGAHKNGVDVTTEAYPYTATATRIDSGIYDEGWQERFGITYKDLQWVETGERLTKESFERYRKIGGAVIGHSIPEEIARLAVAAPEVIIASDGRLVDGKGHPRSAGTFARVLGHYAREEKAIGLMEAIRKMTLLPAERLEKSVPQMQKKGRIKVDCDADLTLFDPEKVIDRATFENPAQFSGGVQYVMVNGVLVVRDGKIVDGPKPGIAIRRTSTIK